MLSFAKISVRAFWNSSVFSKTFASSKLINNFEDFMTNINLQKIAQSFDTKSDKLINTTFSLSENLKSCVDVEKDYILQRLQLKVNEMWNLYFEELNGKDGLIRGEMLGGSLNFTSRDLNIA